MYFEIEKKRGRRPHEKKTEDWHTPMSDRSAGADEETPHGHPNIHTLDPNVPMVLGVSQSDALDSPGEHISPYGKNSDLGTSA